MRAGTRTATIICAVFAVAYAVLSIIRHLHFGSYGFDLGITDQIVWLYSRFRVPITTIQSFPFTSILTDHVELIYILLAPFYWVYRSPITLLVLQAVALGFSGIPIFLLAQKQKFHTSLCFALLISYLMFYGIQNAVWFDVHSLSFGAAAFAWFIYFLDTKNVRWTIITLILAIISKEDVALLTGLVSMVYVIKRRDMLSLVSGIVSFTYLTVIFGIYFPFFTRDGYRYGSPGMHLAIASLYDSVDKRSTWFYSLAWFGLLPLLSPLALIPVIGDLAHYFVFAPAFTAAQGLFMHYRVTLAPLLILPAIDAISRYKKLNMAYIALYIMICALVLQYVLHLPLSYLTKRWFWSAPKSVNDIYAMIALLPPKASVVSQNNITPHISQRPLVFTLYPTTKDFSGESPCGAKTCDWFRWSGNPEYLIVDTSADWDERSYLVPRERFIQGLNNLERNGNIAQYQRLHEAYVYRIITHP